MTDKATKALMEAQGMKPDRHNWLYSFMPGKFDNGQQLADGIFLVAYCKQCDQTVTALAPTDRNGNVRLNRVGLPKVGCDWNGE